jgi:DNA-binding transcriptional MerR regulator
MRRAEIKKGTGIKDATFNNYFVRGIIIVEKDSNGAERSYLPESIPRVNIARRLIALGYNIAEVVGLLSKCSTKEIDEKLDSLPARQLKEWIQQAMK